MSPHSLHVSTYVICAPLSLASSFIPLLSPGLSTPLFLSPVVSPPCSHSIRSSQHSLSTPHLLHPERVDQREAKEK